MKSGPIDIQPLKSLNELLQEVNMGQYEHFRAYLIQKKITDLNLYQNTHQVDLFNLCCALKDTPVTHLDVGINSIAEQDIEKFGLALQGTGITTLYLVLNNISEDGAAALAACIPDTLLTNVALNLEHKALNLALAANKHKLLQTPYTAACLTHLPLDEKKKYSNLPNLSETPSKEEEIQFAGGILASLGTIAPELQAKIISYLPLMNFKSAQKLQMLAQEYHGHGLQIDQDRLDNPWECSIQ